MKLLVTGANGQLGWELARLSPCAISLTRSQLDITQQGKIENAVKEFQPDFIINAAAYTAVDKAEQEKELAYQINEYAIALLAKVCAKNKIPLIHLSTDYVFDGAQKHSYREEDLTNPLGIYGASKLAGELAVREHCDQHIILRVSGVFSAHGNNFVKTILRLAQEKETLKIVDDQMICPTAAKNIAEVIIEICGKLKTNSQSKWGTYHYCNSHPTSWYDFAKEIISLASKHKEFAVKNILPITTAQYPTAATRPLYSVLNCHKMQTVFNIQQGLWLDYLPEVVNSLIAVDARDDVIQQA